MSRTKLSKSSFCSRIWVPVYNEHEVIERFLEQHLCPVVQEISDYENEIILVDDGSEDGTLEIIQKQAEKRKNIKVLAFSRNFGKEAALTAGLRYASGDAVITIDADGQQPAEIIPEFIKKWEEGAEIVTGVRDRFTKHGLVARTGSKLFY